MGSFSHSWPSIGNFGWSLLISNEVYQNSTSMILLSFKVISKNQISRAVWARTTSYQALKIGEDWEELGFDRLNGVGIILLLWLGSMRFWWLVRSVILWGESRPAFDFNSNFVQSVLIFFSVFLVSPFKISIPITGSPSSRARWTKDHLFWQTWIHHQSSIIFNFSLLTWKYSSICHSLRSLSTFRHEESKSWRRNSSHSFIFLLLFQERWSDHRSRYLLHSSCIRIRCELAEEVVESCEFW